MVRASRELHESCRSEAFIDVEDDEDKPEIYMGRDNVRTWPS